MDTVKVKNGDPEGGAAPDDQGNLGVCTRNALAKAIGNGFIDKEFEPGKELDFDQSAISHVLVNEHKVVKILFFSHNLFQSKGWCWKVSYRI